jgi:hypothetical protein
MGQQEIDNRRFLSFVKRREGHYNATEVIYINYIGAGISEGAGLSGSSAGISGSSSGITSGSSFGMSGCSGNAGGCISGSGFKGTSDGFFCAFISSVSRNKLNYCTILP